jgi:leucyl aminopeptidase
MSNQIVFFREITDLDRYSIPQEAKIAYHNYVHKSLWMLEHLGSTHATLFVKLGKESEINDENERLRKEATKVWSFSKEKKISYWNAIYDSQDLNHVVCFFEGFLLSQYQYTAFLKPSEEPPFTSDLKLLDAHQTHENTSRKIVEAVCKARTLVNMPSNLLTAEKLAEEFVSLGEKCGFETQILGKSQIESQKMGGLLSVNKGSQLPPTFSILTYKHENAINEKPIILIGKGVVFDTGGLSLKPTPNSMDYMKCDMAGAAVVASTISGVAALNLPLWIIGLVPATDNRPGENAICPGDIITMFDGTTVEVLNTDAEGRLILGDALSFAKKYEPELVMDFATLTGAAAQAVGPYGGVLMGSASEEVKSELKTTGDSVYERLAELPLWKEYGEEMKGDISDLKNLGKGAGGAQSAAMFLKHFTDYPWLHFDIAGVSFAHAANGYITKGGTGFGVRLLLNYFINKANGN